MYRLVCTLFALVIILPLQAFDDDDHYISENVAKSVRQPNPREPRRDEDKKKEDGKKQEDNKKREIYDAGDVQKILAAKGKDVAVRGQVHEVFTPKSGTVIILNFGSNHRECFKAVVYKRNFEKFDGGAAAIKKMVEGKTIIVEGVVSEYQKLPQITINIPSQLKVEK